MAKKEYNNIRLEPADNSGYLLCYEEVTKEGNDQNKMSANRYEYKKEVFTDEKIAISRMNVLQGKKEEAGGSETESED